MRLAVAILGAVVLAAMLINLSITSAQMPLFEAGYLFEEPWFIATLVDFYLFAVVIYAWVWYRTRSAFARALWAVAFIGLGSIAAGAYLLYAAWRTPAGAPGYAVLLHPGDAARLPPAEHA